jgi:hypothetical protein
MGTMARGSHNDAVAESALQPDPFIVRILCYEKCIAEGVVASGDHGNQGGLVVVAVDRPSSMT